MDKITFQKVPHLQYLQIGVKKMSPGESLNLNFHSHPEYTEVAVVLNTDNTLHCTHGKSIALQTGDVILIQPGEVHAYENTRNFSVLNFLYDAKNLPLPQLDGAEMPLYMELCATKNQGRDPLYPIGRLDEAALGELQQLYTMLANELANHNPGSALKVFGLFITALVTICRCGKKTSGEVRELSALPALHYINLHFKENIAVDKLVALTKLSRSTLFRKFRKLTGYTPADYQRHKKLEAARELLMKSDMTIGEIAFICGFCDSNHLIKLFTAHYGISPGQMRK